MNEKKEITYPDPLTLDFLLEHKLPVYVMNKSNPRGDVTVTYFTQGQQAQLLVIPKTWIPVCVTEQVSHATLETMDDFRRNLAKAMIQLIPAPQAEKILSSSDAQEEKSRLNLSQYGSTGTEVSKYAESGTSNMDGFEEALNDADTIKVKVKDIMSRDVSSTEQYHLLRAEEDLLEKADYNYIIVNGSGKVKEWATQKIEELATEKE